MAYYWGTGDIVEVWMKAADKALDNYYKHNPLSPEALKLFRMPIDEEQMKKTKKRKC